MNEIFDVIVIGAGPAGYHAAIRCAQHGMNTLCIDGALDAEGDPTLGGTCLNWGCIPSKALLDVSHKYVEAKQDYKDIGIECGSVNVNLKQAMVFKDKIVGKLTTGVKTLLTSSGVQVLPGTGQLHADGKVLYQPHTGQSQMLQAKQVILAPGSTPINIQAAPLSDSDDLVVDSTGALEFSELPGRLGIIGAGVIGLELGSIWSRLGSDVVLLEALDTFLPTADGRIAKDALRVLKKQGLNVLLNTRVTDSVRTKKGIKVHYLDKGDKKSLEFDKLIVAVGRRPYTEGLFSDDSGVKLDEHGFIQVDETCYTGVHGVYAVGDAVRGPMLAHKGMEEGLMVADRLAGQKTLVNYNTVPSVIYTAPEIAWVGQSEEQAKANGEPYKVSSVSFAANGRALAGSAAEGTIKIVANSKTDRILGVHILGPQASELIAQAVIAMEFDACAEDLGLIMFAHPTLSETLHEAALHVNGEAIHTISKIKKKK